MKLRFLDVFSGIGGFRKGLEQAGHECIGHIEKDKYARMSYQALYGEEPDKYDREDITEIEDFKELKGTYELLTGGFPCQSFSIAGKRKGFLDTRGTMFFHLAKIMEQTKPPICLFENVKGLLSHDQGRTFQRILTVMDELGYDAQWQVLNSKDFGVPQNRERIFLIGLLRGRCSGKIFPLTTTGREDFSNAYTTTIPTRYRGTGGETYIGHSCSQKKLIQLVDGTQRTKNRVRRLTPKECWRLQGFSDEDVEKVKSCGLSDAQLYKQAGNAVTVNVIYAIGQALQEITINTI